jgi:DNA-binding transcriptional regulator GbsR (MarR family)
VTSQFSVVGPPSVAEGLHEMQTPTLLTHYKKKKRDKYKLKKEFFQFSSKGITDY